MADTMVEPLTESASPAVDQARLEELLGGLNPVQREAASAPDGPVLVVAGAGSGKTRVLTHRIAYLIASKRVSPFGVLAITFTNKAAGEMKERVGELVGPVAHRMWVSTFHSACARILRREASLLGLRPQFSIYDQSDAVRLTDYVRRDLNLDPKRFPPRQLHARISAMKNDLVGPEEAKASAVTPPEHKLADVYVEYQRRLLDASAVDFDDLLTLVVKLFREFPDALARWQHRFRYILVDEFQDTNLAQWEMVRMLAAEHRNVMVVGDVDQSIYRFRGADYRNLLRFEEVFPEATVIVLEQNYRSTQRILDAANAVIANNAARKPKHLWTEQVGGELLTRYQAEDEHDEARFVAHEVTRLTDTEGQRFSDIAVFYRTNAQSRIIEEMLVRAGIPYRVVGGTKFYDRREVKDALAYLRALVNPDDEVSWKRVVNTPKRGVGDTSVAKVEAYAQGAHLTFRDALREAAVAGVHGKALGGIKDLLELMIAFEGFTADGVGATVQKILDSPATSPSSRPSARSRRRVASRTSRSSSGVCREFDAALDAGQTHRPPGDRRGRHPERCGRRQRAVGRRGARGAGRDPDRPGADPGVPRGDLARHRHGRGGGRGAELGHAHDAAHRQGPRVPGRVPDGPRGRRVPARARARRPRGARGGAAALLRRHHPGAGAPVPLPRVEPHAVRRDRLLPAEPVPRRDPRGARARDRRGPSHAAAGSARTVTRSSARRSGAAARRPAPVAPEELRLKIGDDVTHEKFGEGVILDLEGTGDKAEVVVQLPRRRREAPAPRVGAARTARLTASASK